MIIAGAGGHAKEILGILSELNIDDNVYFFDDINTGSFQNLFFERYNILRSIDQVKEIFYHEQAFVLGVGTPATRKVMADKLIKGGGRLESVISPYARIGKNNIVLGQGLNIMTGAVITADVSINDGTLVHINVSIHHDCKIGQYCELSPGCIILGNVTIGDFTSIGSGAILLPGITVGKYVTVGAGAVVTKNIKDGIKVKGVPAK